ncbi:uncharacterized protein BXIN_2511 [Babesia sp. Xinjiang]|uniref:uncharacterized protein n=1 Tax=Babesia sp. Xinjiang TaxID=462227 RepID=UPI000A21B7B2|nr:uncharacterized protein BXIN_2511 [Babesia sp. Xinjiang]ORM41439.1 hypothetical protein BXIN_2511 [Babesia sp. Xinjiang]
MELQITGPFNRLSTEDLEILDDVVQSFCEAVDVVLKTNFKSQKKDNQHLESTIRTGTTRPEGITKNQRIAAVFCRQWIAGVVSELTHKLAEDTSDRANYQNIPKITNPEILNEDDEDKNNQEDIGLCVENAQICGSGQIEVNYDLQPNEVPPHLKPKLKAQELTQLILQGKQTEHELMQKLEQFWNDVPSLLCQYLDEDDEGEQDVEHKTDDMANVGDTATNMATDDAQTTNKKPADEPIQAQKNSETNTQLPFDNDAIEFLENLARGATEIKDKELAMDEPVQQKLAHLAEKANELGIQGMDTYIALYNKVNREINKINKMAKFFSKMANDITTARSQIDII